MSLIRELVQRDRYALDSLLAADPIGSCFAAARIAEARDSGSRPDVWVHEPDNGPIDAAVLLGANLVPIATSPQARAAFARRLVYSGRRCSSIVGPAEEVLDLWRILEPYWGPARQVRADQPLLATNRRPPVPADPLVRTVLPQEFDLLLPACVAMFTEEVGVDPMAAGGGPVYRQRVRSLIDRGLALARIVDRRVQFKAEFGAVTDQAVQVQGVWVDPADRGAGLGAAGMAAVVRAGLRLAPWVTLYVNDYNAPALAVYGKVGFRQVGSYATVLF